MWLSHILSNSATGVANMIKLAKIQMLSKTGIVAAGVCGTLFIGYCIYFDRKRRSDPLFKKKLIERRAKAKLKKEQEKKNSLKVPDLRDPASVYRFFMQQLQIGEELVSEGDYENGAEHLSIAVLASGQPERLLPVMQSQLPLPVFQMLLEKLPKATEKFKSAFQVLEDEDVE